MYPVSSEYKTQIKQSLRNPSSMKILLDIENELAKDGATPTVNNEVAISNVSVLADDYIVNTRLGTMEQNRFLLDGNSQLAPDADPAIYQALISYISDGSGTFTTQPVLTLTFDDYYNFDGLSFLFDNLLYNYPTEMSIVSYNDATVLYSDTVNPDNYEWTYVKDIVGCNKFVITAVSSSIPNARFRIEDVIFGIVKEFGSDVITDSLWKRDVDLIDAKLPIYTFDFTVLDLLKEYNPDDPDSLYDSLSGGQRVRFYYGYDLNDTTTEWIKGSEYFTTGEISIDSQSGISTLSLKTASRLYFLTQEYTDGKFQNTPWSLGALLSTLIEFMGINPLYTQYSSIVYNYTDLDQQTLIPLPRKPINQCLQLIANASLCLLQVDRDGRIVISRRKAESQDFSLTFMEMMKPPLITKYPQLQGVDTAITLLSKETTASTILSQAISVTTPTFFEFTYDGYTDVSVTSGALTITNEEIYDTLYRATINGTGTLTISGKQIITTEQNYSYEYQAKGERCPIKNELIAYQSHAVDFATWVAEYASCSNQYEIEDRGFPELDIDDNITFDTFLSPNLYGTVFYSEIKYNGALSGKTKILNAKNMFTTIINRSGTFYAGQDLILPTSYSK